MGRREGRRGGGKEEGRKEKNLRKQDSQNGVRTVMESKEREILIERGIMGLARNMALGKFQGSIKIFLYRSFTVLNRLLPSITLFYEAMVNGIVFPVFLLIN